MKVLKFGGTSVGTAATIRQAAEIIRGRNEDLIVVVSALGGITDEIHRAAALAEKNDGQYHRLLEGIRERHLSLCAELMKEDPDTTGGLKAILQEMDQILTGVTLIGELTLKTLDRLLAMGERMSSLIISRFLGTELKNAADFIVTDSRFGKAAVDFDVTNRRIASAFAGHRGIAVVPGFIAKNPAGEYTTLGRGGSDYTGAILAAALDASALEIWTDVDGFMTADPKVISKAYTIPVLSYGEAMELSNFGARVIYPPTILPVYKKEIPVCIRNTFRPEAAGTLIVRNSGNGRERPIKGISSIPGIALVTLQGIGMVGVTGISMRLFTAIAREKINIIFISQASSENTISFAVEETAAAAAAEAAEKEFEREIARDQINRVLVETGLSIVAIVGENMRQTTGVAGKLFSTLGRNGINVISIAQGASELNISWVIRNSDLRKTLNVVHESCFLSENVELNLFLMGTGLVGSHLLSQIAAQQGKLLRESRLKIRLAGIANVHRMHFDREGMDIGAWKQLLAESSLAASVPDFIHRMTEMNLYNSVFVDCTASPEIAASYLRILESNISVVAANKIAASSEYDNYFTLKRTAKNKGIKFLFETNVGAGLPIINTLNDLVNSGDKVIRIDAVLSGTLNYIFNTLSEENPLSVTVRKAQEAGYTEPDPRVDLSGSDVVRKLLILARESGYRLEKEEITVHPIIPAFCFEGTADDFWNRITELDADFETRRKLLAAKNMRWRFVAVFEEGNPRVELQEVGPGHPFYDLEGSNNLIMYRTERYNEFPMLIKGYGAGAAVTAAGVFADLIKVSSI